MSQAPQIALLSIALAAVAWAQAKPDFSGVWKLNIEETEFTGPKPSASTFSAVRTVQQTNKDIRLKIENNRNGKKGGFDFVTIPIAGEPHVSDEAGIITAEWKGETLHFHYLYNPGTDRQSERTEDWTLSADGKKIVDQEERTQPDGKVLRYKIVFDKQ
jgi:hypothetical protein